MTIPVWVAILLHNPMFMALGGAGIIGGLFVWLRNIPARIWAFLVYMFTVQVHIEGNDPAFHAINAYLANHAHTKKQRKLRLTSPKKMDDEGYSTIDMSASWLFAPGLGKSWMMQGWRLITLDRHISEGKDGQSPREYMTVRVVGRSQEPLRKFINAAYVLAAKDTRQSIWSYVEGYWRATKKSKPRNPDTIFLKEGQKERILADLKWFYESEEWYHERAIPWHRGYLLSGPPGTGKTSLIAALAGYYNKDVALLNLGTIASDDALFSALRNAPENAVIAIEDVDCASEATEAREDKKAAKAKGKTGISLAGLLNALDGTITPEGMVFIMTTNHPDQLDSALIRPGRADLHETLGLMDKAQQIEMSLRFYKEGIYTDQPISPATMQGILIANPNPEDRDKALEALRNI